jgi:protein-disulfide isomerase
MPLLEAEYVKTGKVKYVVHPFNLGRPETALATEAAWCAHDQGKFFEYEHALYENQGQIAYNQKTLADLAATVGVERESFAQCLSSRKHQADVENARRAAVNRGIMSTPTFFINKQRVEGNQSIDAFKRAIDQELVLSQ